ncbi:FAD-binding oxidoreductase, partial [Pseudomonas syringae pv. tagetis]
ALIDELQTVDDTGKVLTDADYLQTYGKDWTRQFTPAPLAIVFPKTTEQIQPNVRWANERLEALVPSRGRTALSAAPVESNG